MRKQDVTIARISKRSEHNVRRKLYPIKLEVSDPTIFTEPIQSKQFTGCSECAACSIYICSHDPHTKCAIANADRLCFFLFLGIRFNLPVLPASEIDQQGSGIQQFFDFSQLSSTLESKTTRDHPERTDFHPTDRKSDEPSKPKTDWANGRCDRRRTCWSAGPGVFAGSVVTSAARDRPRGK